MHIQCFYCTIILFLWLSTADRFFDDAISGRAKEIFAYIAPNYNITLEEWNHDKDHVHILFKAHPNTEISKFINAYKSAMQQTFEKRIPADKEKAVEKNISGVKSFCLLTTGRCPDGK